GFLFSEKKHERKIVAEKLEEYHVPVTIIPDLKKGLDLDLDGITIPNSELTTDPSPRKSYSFCSDSLYNENILPQIRETDLLYHEATFMQDSSVRAELTFHSTTIQAARIARQAHVKRLMIGHFSAKYEDLQLVLEEAKTEFENTELAIEGET